MLNNQLNKMNYIVCLKMATKILSMGICFLIFLSGLFYANKTSLAHFVEPEKGDICPVSGMSVSEEPLWVAVIMFSDGKHVKLHGPKSMFTYYFNLEKYEKKYRMKNVATIHVRDYYTHVNIEAEKAHYIIHSEIEGPMGAELIPLEDKASAEAFTKEHGGNIFLFKDITPEIVNSLKNIVPDKSPTIQ
jgi:nitrous oxide reductase accessory protein NosL